MLDPTSFRWFFRSKFALMQAFREEGEPMDADAHLSRALAKARRGELARSVVSVLLLMGAVATLAATHVGAQMPGSPARVAETLRFLTRLAAISGSLTVALLALRLAIARWLDRLETATIFLSMRTMR